MPSAQRRVARLMFGAALAAAGSAEAAQYLVSATAGNVSDSHESLDDALATASSLLSGGVAGAAQHDATADLSGGVLGASVSITAGNQMTFGLNGGRASARFEETIAFQQSLAVPVTISASLLAGLDAPMPQFPSGFPAVAQAFAYLDVAGCRTAFTKTNGGPPEDTSLCDNAEHGWHSGGGDVEVVIDPAVFPGTSEVAIEAQVDASFINPGYVILGDASAQAGISLSVSPAVAFEFTGSQTAFPVPEPGAAALGASASLCVAALARRRARIA